MTDSAWLLSIICGMAGCIGGIFVWIYQHTRTCHAGRTPEQVAQAAHEAAVEAAAKAELHAEVQRLSLEVGHQTQHGSILERMHRFSGYLRVVMERLDIQHSDE